jgi:hypothetical protein
MSNADVPMPSTDPRGISTFFKAPPSDMSAVPPLKQLAKGFNPEEWREGIDICLQKVQMNEHQKQEWRGGSSHAFQSFVDQLLADVRASIPDNLQGLETSRPEWLPSETLWLGPGMEGWKLYDLIPGSFWRQQQLEEEGEAGEEARQEEDERRAEEMRHRMASEEMEEQAQVGTSRERQEEVQDRAAEDIQCIGCGGTNNPQDIILCGGAEQGTSFHTGLHTHPSIGWHSGCLPAHELEMPLEELQQSPEELEWCCRSCATHLAGNGVWIGWKIVSQKLVSGKQVYTVQWLGDAGTSDQYFRDVRGTVIHREWMKNRRNND